MDVKQALKIWAERNERIVNTGFTIMMHDRATIEEAGNVIIDDQQRQIDRLGVAAKVAVDMIKDSNAERDEARRDAVEMAERVQYLAGELDERLGFKRNETSSDMADAIIAKYEKGEGIYDKIRRGNF